MKRLGRARTALVVAPHGDDEAIGAYHLIRALIAGGARVRVVVVTDGAGSHRNSSRWPRDRLVRERRREVRRAMRELGIGAGGVAFLDLPDGAMQHADARALRPLGRAARLVRELDLLVGPTPDDDHADHRVTARVLRATRLPGARRLHYEVWTPGEPGRRGARLRVGGPPAVKRRVVAGYATQTGRITDDPAGFALTRQQVAGFSAPFEMFREGR